MQKRYRDAGSLFFEEVMVGVQVATMQKDKVNYTCDNKASLCEVIRLFLQ